MANPVTNPKMYAQIGGIVLAAVAVLGIILNAINQPNLLGADFLAFDWTHNILHVVLAAIALIVGYTKYSSMAKTYAMVFGIVYAALGVLGFFVMSLGPLHLELGENLVHLLLGAWGIIAGFFGTTTTGTTTTPGTT